MVEVTDRVEHRPLPHHLGEEPRPFSFGVLYDLIVPVPGPVKADGKRADGDVAAVALRLGIDRAQVYRWLHEGLGAYVADGLAIRIGLHPSELWEDWYEHCPTDADIDRIERASDRHGLLARMMELRPSLSWEAIRSVVTAEGFTNPATGRAWTRCTLRRLHDDGGRVAA